MNTAKIIAITQPQITSYVSEPDKEFRESSGNEVQNKYIRIIKKCRDLVKDHP